MARLSITATFGTVFLLGLSAQAFAAAEGYCDAFARDAANRKARNAAGNVLAGSATNPVIAGVSIGSVGGTAAMSADAANSKWRRAYISAYDDCMFQYEGEKVAVAAAAPSDEAPSDEVASDEAVVEEVNAQADIPVDEAAPEKPARKAKAKGKPDPGTQAWNNACDRRYRSFNPKTGNYKSLSGRWRKCQL